MTEFIAQQVYTLPSGIEPQRIRLRYELAGVEPSEEVVALLEPRALARFRAWTARWSAAWETEAADAHGDTLRTYRHRPRTEGPDPNGGSSSLLPTTPRTEHHP